MIGVAAQRGSGPVDRHACRSATCWGLFARKAVTIPGLPWGKFRDFPVGETRLASFVTPESMPWDGATRKAACWVRRTQRREVPDFRHQLRPPGMPRPLVSSVRALYVSLSRRGLLRRWLPCRRTTAAWLFEYAYKVQNGKLMIDAGQMPTLATSASCGKRAPHALVEARSTTGWNSG